MVQFSNEEKYDMLKCFIESGEDENLASELYFNRYPEKIQSNPKIFKRLQSNLKDFGSFVKPRPKIYYKPEREAAQNIIVETVRDNPNISYREIEENLGMPKTTVLRCLRKNKFKPYRIRITHHLFPNDFQRRLDFCHWFLHKCNESPGFEGTVIWTDETHISSAGIFNRHNNHHWAQENPYATATVNRQGRFGFGVWCGLMGHQVIGPYFYRGNLNSETYIQILRQEVETYIDNLPVRQFQRIYFQHDGAPSHTSCDTRNYLNVQFGENWIENNGPILWPARSPDITPCDFWLWGHLQNMIYREPSNNIEELENRTLAAFRKITPIMIRNATNAVKRRCQKCIDVNGRQFENLFQ